MQYYHDLVTQQSWEELKSLQKTINFMLIGGWAVYLYSGNLKSKDIDIIIDYDQLPVIAKLYQLNKNERLHKYEAVKGEVQIDIYLPHFSQLGIPVEEIIKYPFSLEGYQTIDLNYLFSLKLYTLSQRGRSPKGRKDFIDLISLFLTGHCDYRKILELINNYQLQASLPFFSELLGETTQVAELQKNKHQFAKIKNEILTRLIQRSS